jgi:hypothetical protein
MVANNLSLLHTHTHAHTLTHTHRLFSTMTHAHTRTHCWEVFGVQGCPGAVRAVRQHASPTQYSSPHPRLPPPDVPDGPRAPRLQPVPGAPPEAHGPVQDPWPHGHMSQRTTTRTLAPPRTREWQRRARPGAPRPQHCSWQQPRPWQWRPWQQRPGGPATTRAAGCRATGCSTRGACWPGVVQEAEETAGPPARAEQAGACSSSRCSRRPSKDHSRSTVGGQASAH